MPRLSISLLILTALLTATCENPKPSNSGDPSLNPEGKQEFIALYGSPVLDGSGSDDVWSQCEWYNIDQVWFGEPPTPKDFYGQYKLAWDENNLYILAEIVDDSLLDIHPESLERYWDDDCLEIFLDEDASGGIHQYSYNAFAYHISLDGHIVDIGPDSLPHFYDDHCLTRRITRGNTSTWEIAVRIFDGNQFDDTSENVPKLLSAGKKMGFALAYCDNDRSLERENFIGSVAIPGEDKNRGWIDADVFGILELHQH
ncbi:MAG: sugar-binding protein [Bacteroidetes bacterium]|nr:MAG: sugar-binding protein [Bacteroidota bacterium]